MDKPQIDPRPGTAEDPAPQDAEEKHGIGVAAKAQEPLRLVHGEEALLVKLRRRPGPDGVAPHQAQQQGRPGGTREAVKAHQS